MSSKINTVKGFADHLKPEAALFNHIAGTARDVFGSYGYREVHIPILEYTELFSRSIGAETDVVQKEMFTFPDRKGRSLTLRPEATAGLMRSYIEHSTHAREPVTKLFTHGPMFRYERPQKGRMRQFHQVDCECLGATEPHVDAEMILMLMDYLTRLGIKDLSLEINTLGCRDCRPAYQETLRAYLLKRKKEDFCEDCQRRMDTNPLRVLDCKNPACKAMTEEAPNIFDNVCPDCRAHFEVVLRILNEAGLAHSINHRLVRGLDYYTRTTFEAVSGNIGAQSSVAGGGRYDGLIADLGGPDIPGVGFACGLERLALLLPEQPAETQDFYIAVLDEAALDEALLLACRLRKNGLTGEASYSAGSIKSQMRKADAAKASYCLILGGNELARGTVLVKNLHTGEQAEKNRAALNSLK
ncbi:MAG: histidine--tRNA ligase [Deltaproteobacteria bacterium]|jgi:histidyl-tRNA synthetase|nr:histidine--tRNA ligase [Deltaproteobacteria bacterium]